MCVCPSSSARCSRTRLHAAAHTYLFGTISSHACRSSSLRTNRHHARPLSFPSPVMYSCISTDVRMMPECSCADMPVSGGMFISFSRYSSHCSFCVAMLALGVPEFPFLLLFYNLSFRKMTFRKKTKTKIKNPS